MPAQLWLLLLEVAHALDIEVRLESIEQPELNLRGGGLCRIKGKTVLFIDKRLNVEARLKGLGRAIKRYNIDEISMRPLARDFLENLTESF